jgi:hypothetical protein
MTINEKRAANARYAIACQPISIPWAGLTLHFATPRLLNVLSVSGKPKIFANSLGGEGGVSGSDGDTTEDGEGGGVGVGPFLTGPLEVGEDGIFLSSEVMVIIYQYFYMFIFLIGLLILISSCLKVIPIIDTH